MKMKISRVTLIITAVAVMLGVFAFPLPEVYGSTVTLTAVREDVATPGLTDVTHRYIVTNNTSFTLLSVDVILADRQGIRDTRASFSGPDIIIRFDLNESVRPGSRSYDIVFNQGTPDEVRASGEFFLLIVEDVTQLPPPELPGEPRTYRAAADITHSLFGASGFGVGRENSINFLVHNRGDTPIRNAEFTITLPDGMSVYNASTTAFVGTVSIGQRIGRTFSVMVYDDIQGGRAYPITLTVTGTDRNNSPISLERTFYISVQGSGAGAVRDITIENIELPSEVSVDEEFELTFSVINSGTATIRNVKAYADIPENLLNLSNATFVIDSLGPGETRNFSIILTAREGSNRSIPIKIAVEPLSGSTGNDVIRYASVFAGGGAGAARTPQLMVDRYSYGGTSVLAGKEFELSMSFVNTSSRSLSNIRATLSSEGGTFVPVDSSNSFFVDSVPAGGKFSRTVTLRAIPSAEQRTTAITVTMTYEDGNGEFSAQDIISIPIMQAMRLHVDEIVPPFEVYAFTPGFSSLQFYNMGHTTLNNLMITAEGEFDVMQSNSYYVGNMQGGTSDTFSFSFIPRGEGPMEGKVIFTYENIDGEQIIHEVPFVFMVMEMPVWDDMWRDPMPESRTPWALIIFGIAALAAVAGIVVWRKMRKKKLEKALEIEDIDI